MVAQEDAGSGLRRRDATYLGRAGGFCQHSSGGRAAILRTILRAMPTQGLFVPNDSDQRKWMASVGDGNDRKLAADLHRSINYRQRLAMAVGRENVPVCVRSKGRGGPPRLPRVAELDHTDA